MASPTAPQPAVRRTARKRVPAPVEPVAPEEPGTNYALRLTAALEAISSAQAGSATSPAARRADPAAVELSPPTSRRGLRARPATVAPTPAVVVEQTSSVEDPIGQPSFARRVLNGLDQLPPIRLPIGPPIPWRLAVPALLVLLLALTFVSHPTSGGDAQGVRLPPAPPTALPLFASQPPAAADVSTVDSSADLAPTPQPGPVNQTPAQAPLGVPDPAGTGFDVFDIGLKLIAVLALAYGSLLLLKRTRFGNGLAGRTAGGQLQGMRVVSSLALAPNRSVHLLKVPGGRTLVVGATPNQVNLIADLGELTGTENLTADGSFFDVLKGKIG